MAYFSLGGRITRIQASFTSIPLHYLSMFKIPVGVAKRIIKIMRDFLLFGCRKSKKDYLPNREMCCRSEEDGGLALSNLVSKIISLVAK